MKTDVVKPKDIFYNPIRFVVPLFQRPYVWSKETQWLPLWNDITRLIEVINHHNKSATHFLGAIVIQSVPTGLADLPTWNVIDGQQRLTTLQLFLDALHTELSDRSWSQLAGRVLALVENPSDFRNADIDQFKLWPTNRDRADFASVMSAPAPVDYSVHGRSRLGEAHRFFADSIKVWLGDDEDSEKRGRMLVATVMDRLEVASIRLDEDEDAQAIFETLNARGTPLSAADLIKNFVFQNFTGQPEEAEYAYHSYWAEFETPWWEQLITSGRIKNTRSSLFLWQWLTARTLDDFPIREVFTQFKHYVNTSSTDVSALLPQIKRAADRYRGIIDRSHDPNGTLSRIELFSYRVGLLDSEIARPLLIWLDEPEQESITLTDREQILSMLESWFVRRALVKASSQGTNRFIIDLLRRLSSQPKHQLVQATRDYLASSHVVNGYWPDDGEVRNALVDAPAYTKYRRDRLRMVFEALEDFKRGYPSGSQLAMGPIVRGKGTIEHLMPQKWREHWSAELTHDQEIERNRVLQRLGNLTLVTQKLNSKISNGSWEAKRKHFLSYDDVLLTKDALNIGASAWDETTIDLRTTLLIDEILKVWPVPPDHVGLTIEVPSQLITATVDVAQLVASGWIEAGTELVPRNRKYADTSATVAQDGRLYIGDTPFQTPTAASFSVYGAANNGWWWWTVRSTGKSLHDVRAEFVASLGEDEISMEEPVDDAVVE
ncbi:DUF262 domain-containing protein [Brevibacterium sanguinis]|uniref:GmrSD restriction endonuclease domain-containing protein n=1 Tax=Brevibacterium sanguinis TaxID=232444 RepID=UPI0031D25EA6